LAIFDSHSGAACPPPPPERDGPALVMSAGPVSVTALHEAGHIVVARYLGLPVASATVLANAHFHGIVLGPEGDPNASPEQLAKAAEALCAQAAAIMPSPGEDLVEAASWLVHVTSRCAELLAGFVVEKLGGYAGKNEPQSTDLQLARIYAASCHAPAAVEAFLEYCRAVAASILVDHFGALKAVAQALDASGMMTGAELDVVIFEAEGEATQARELERREASAGAIRRAAAFIEEEGICRQKPIHFSA
jgi:hypothetical protein